MAVGSGPLAGGMREVARLKEAYEALAEALRNLPNGFCRTESGVEIEILKIMFTAEEAELARLLSDIWEPAGAISARAGAEDVRTKGLLKDMARKGTVLAKAGDGELLFRLNKFIVGSYESTMQRLEGDLAHRFAHLFEEYLIESGGLADMMRPDPAIHRVVPAHGATKTEWILPYDDVKAFLEGAKSFYLIDCVCKKQQDLLGTRKCDFPLRSCLSWAPVERPASPYSVSREEALAFLDEAERIGLVHTVSNVAKGINYVCNCCGCCCGILRGISEFGINESVAHANYYAAVDAESCSGCGLCQDRCQVHAVAVRDGVAVIDRIRCIGCGLCVTACATGAAQLHLKPENEIVEPPADLGVWSQRRKKSRGLE